MGSHCCHLTLDERRKLAKWLEARMLIVEIAHRLGRAPFRAVKRNFWADDTFPKNYAGYICHAEELQAGQQRSVTASRRHLEVGAAGRRQLPSSGKDDAAATQQDQPVKELRRKRYSLT